MKKQIVGTYGFILNDNGEFLIIQRSKTDSHPGLWELPGGGSEFGEHPQDAVKREVREETGLDVEVLHPISVISHLKHDSVQLIMLVFFCRMTDTTQTVKLSHEHIDYTWISVETYYDKKKTEFIRQIMENFKNNEVVNEVFKKYTKGEDLLI